MYLFKHRFKKNAAHQPAFAAKNRVHAVAYRRHVLWLVDSSGNVGNIVQAKVKSTAIALKDYHCSHIKWRKCASLGQVHCDISGCIQELSIRSHTKLHRIEGVSAVALMEPALHSFACVRKHTQRLFSNAYMQKNVLRL